MKLTVNVCQAVKAMDALHDNRFLINLLVQTYSNVWEITTDNDSVQEYIEQVLTEIGIDPEEYQLN